MASTVSTLTTSSSRSNTLKDTLLAARSLPVISHEIYAAEIQTLRNLPLRVQVAGSMMDVLLTIRPPMLIIG